MLRRRLAKGLDIDDAALAAAVAQRPPLAAAFVAWLGPSDVAILPVMTIRTPPAVECDPERAEFRPRTLYELSRLTRFVNMIGFPAVALPVGFDDRGLPVALQIVGRPGADRALLALAAAVQQRSDWHGRVPAIASRSRTREPAMTRPGDRLERLCRPRDHGAARRAGAIGLDPVAWRARRSSTTCRTARAWAT